MAYQRGLKPAQGSASVCVGAFIADGPAQHKDTWRKSMRQIRTLPGVDSLTPVYDKIRMLHEADCIALPPRTTLLSIVIPSSRLLDKLDPHRAMSIDDLRETKMIMQSLCKMIMQSLCKKIMLSYAR